jgi:hypothetical protein
MCPALLVFISLIILITALDAAPRYATIGFSYNIAQNPYGLLFDEEKL